MVFLAGNMGVAAHVEQRLRLLGDVAKAAVALALQTVLAHISTIADPCHHLPQALQLGVRAADGANGHAQLVRQQAMGRQLATGGQRTVGNGLFQGLGQSLVLGAHPFLQCGTHH